MEVIKKLKIHGKYIICKIKKCQSRRSISTILSYGHLRVVCGDYFTESRIISSLESMYSAKKIAKINSEELMNDKFVYLLGEKRRIVVLNEGQNSTSMTDLIVRDRKDVNKYIDKFRMEVYLERVRRYEHIMNSPYVHEVKTRSFDRAYGKNFYGPKRIVLEKRLIHFSLDIIDHTVMHEIAHDYHHNHSKDFYRVLELFCPDHKKLKEKLSYGVRK